MIASELIKRGAKYYAKETAVIYSTFAHRYPSA
jgi:hypothetical protein